VIAVDTSALMAIVLDEPSAEACRQILKAETTVIISAATFAEVMIVAEGRGVGDVMARLIEGLRPEIVSVTPASARCVAQAYAAWGKGVHSARLNFGDCFSYAVAKEYACPLLFVGEDFSKTDVEGVL
jgi:ribonuclease VapC